MPCDLTGPWVSKKRFQRRLGVGGCGWNYGFYIGKYWCSRWCSVSRMHQRRCSYTADGLGLRRTLRKVKATGSPGRSARARREGEHSGYTPGWEVHTSPFYAFNFSVGFKFFRKKVGGKKFYNHLVQFLANRITYFKLMLSSSMLLGASASFSPPFISSCNYGS